MAYRVRTPDGELSFASLYDIERAYAHGLVDENDEVRDEGGTTWRKVGSIPALKDTRPPRSLPKRALLPWVVISVLIGAWAMYDLVRGNSVRALVLCLIVGALGSGVTYKAFKN